MIQEINSSLRQVSRDIHRLRTLALQREALQQELAQAEVELAEANVILEKEIHDVDRLTDPGLPRLWHVVRPRKQNRWEREKEEYLQAKRQVEIYHFMVDNLRTQILQIEQEAAILGDSDKIYQELMVLKERYIRQNKHPDLSKILEQEEIILEAEAKLKKLEEADQSIAQALRLIIYLREEFTRLNRVEAPSDWMTQYYEMRILNRAKNVQHQMIEVRKEMQDVMGESFQLRHNMLYFSQSLLRVITKPLFMKGQVRAAQEFIDDTRKRMAMLSQKLILLTEAELRKIRIAKQRMQQIVENV